MATFAPAPARRVVPRSWRRTAVEAVVALVIAGLLLGLCTVVADRSSGNLVVFVLGALLAVGLFVNPRIELNLVVLAVYLGCADGPAKLLTNSQAVTLVRDVLIFAVLGGILARATVTKQQLPRIPYALPLLVFALITLAMGAHPDTPGIKGAIAGFRQEFEFIPFLLFGVLVAWRPTTLRVLAYVLFGILVANVIVAFLQYNLSPEQFASWGPGYADRILGKGAFSGQARVFVAEGVARVRPFGLGADFGASAFFAWAALPFGLAFLAARGRARTLGGVTVALSVLGIILAQSRGGVLCGTVALLAFVALRARTNGAAPAILALGAAAFIAFSLTSVFASQASKGSLDRLQTVVPGQAASTIQRDRGGSLAIIPKYPFKYPVGVGIGRVGPAMAFGGSPSGLNAESQFAFMSGEVGGIGLAAFLLLWLLVVRDSVRLARDESDSDEQILLCALAAVLLTATVSWFQGVVTVAPPVGPLFWFAAGIIGVRMHLARTPPSSAAACDHAPAV